MGKRIRRGSLADYIAEILKNAVYEKGEELDVIVAEAPDLPGCVTQGDTVEEARENLVDAIEVWLMSGLRSGEDPPVVNGCRLAITVAPSPSGLLKLGRDPTNGLAGIVDAFVFAAGAIFFLIDYVRPYDPKKP